MRKRLNNFLLFFALFCFVSSLLAKFSIRDHALYFYDTNDLDHVFLAMETWGQSQLKKIDWFEYFLDNLDTTQPPKYPYFLTLIYLNLIDWFKPEVTNRPEILQITRTFHILIFGLSGLLLFFVPISLKQRCVALILLSTSLLMHQYSVVCRVHAAMSFFLLLSLLVSWKFLCSKQSFLWAIFHGLSVGLAASCFHAGFIGFFPFVVALLFKRHQGSWPLLKTLTMILVSSVMALFLYTCFYPSLFEFALGRAPIFYDTHLQAQITWGWNGLKSYFNSLSSYDPLLGIAYLSGLYTLWKSASWKSSFWLMSLSLILPYQLILAMIDKNPARWVTALIPVMVIIASFGLATLWRKGRRVRFGTAILFLFSAINLIRYNDLINKDTRQLAYEYVRENIPDRSLIMIDPITPVYDVPKDESDKKTIQAILSDKFVKGMRQRTKDPNTGFSQYFEGKGLGKEVFEDPQYLPLLMEMVRCDYYVHHYLPYASQTPISSESIIEKGELVAQWQPFSSSKEYDWRWPTNRSNEFWHIWKMWRATYSGHTIEIYKMPWADN